jgi:hypothetical protein
MEQTLLDWMPSTVKPATAPIAPSASTIFRMSCPAQLLRDRQAALAAPSSRSRPPTGRGLQVHPPAVRSGETSRTESATPRDPRVRAMTPEPARGAAGSRLPARSSRRGAIGRRERAARGGATSGAGLPGPVGTRSSNAASAAPRPAGHAATSRAGIEDSVRDPCPRTPTAPAFARPKDARRAHPSLERSALPPPRRVQPHAPKPHVRRRARPLPATPVTAFDRGLPRPHAQKLRARMPSRPRPFTRRSGPPKSAAARDREGARARRACRRPSRRRVVASHGEERRGRDGRKRRAPIVPGGNRCPATDDRAPQLPRALELIAPRRGETADGAPSGPCREREQARSLAAPV